MPAKKRTMRKTRLAPVQRAAKSLAKTWDDTREALGTAEAVVEKRVRALVKKSGVDTRQARETLAGWRTRLERERKKAVKQVGGQLQALQTRARKERKAAGRAVDDAVARALAALNIPSRSEIHELSRKVEELSRRIDGFRRAPRRA